jgi:hypothetical protein
VAQVAKNRGENNQATVCFETQRVLKTLWAWLPAGVLFNKTDPGGPGLVLGKGKSEIRSLEVCLIIHRSL